MFFFAANTDVFVVGGYYYYNAKIIVQPRVVAALGFNIWVVDLS